MTQARSSEKLHLPETSSDLLPLLNEKSARSAAPREPKPLFLAGFVGQLNWGSFESRGME